MRRASLSSVRTAALLLPVGVAVLAALLAHAPGRAEATADQPKTFVGPPEPSRADLFGDPLPEGALARLGTTRLYHGGYIIGLAFSADGKLLMSAGGENSIFHRGQGYSLSGGSPIRCWDTATGKEVRQLTGHNGIIRTLVLAPDGKTLASAPDKGPVRLWDMATGKEKGRISAPGLCSRIAFSPDGKYLAGESFQPGNAILLWDPATGKVMRELALPAQQRTNALAFAPDGKTLVSSNGSTSVFLWDVATGRQLLDLKGHAPGAVRAVAFAPDGKTVASGSTDRTVRCWEVASGKELYKFEGHGGLVNAVAFSPDGKTLATTGERRTILLDAKTGKQVRAFEQTAGGHALAFSPDGKTLAWGEGQIVRLADVATGKDLSPSARNTGQVECVAFSPDGRTVVSVGGGLQLWETATGKARPYEARSLRASCAAFSPDGRTVAVGSPDQTIRLADAATGKEVRTFTGECGMVEFLSFLPDGKTVASASRYRLTSPTRQDAERKVRLWSTETGKEVGHVSVPWTHRIALSADGRTLVSGLNDIQIWDVGSGAELRKIVLRGRVPFLALSPDGRKLLSATGDQKIVLWEVASGQQVRSFTGHEGAVLGGAVSPDGKVLASAGLDGTVRLWDLHSGKGLRSFRGHQGAVFTVAFSPDGRRLVSGGKDTTALVWDVSGVSPARPPAVRLSPDELKNRWGDLAGDDAAKADAAVSRLVRAPGQTVPFVREQLGANPLAEGKRIARLIADLDSDRFAVRERATAELAALGKVAEPALRQALTDSRSAEVRRRADELLKKLGGPAVAPELLRALRALDVLEQIDTAEARQILAALAKGAEPGVAREAKAALDRLAKRPRTP
jgi:WD40 repeat protein